MTEPTDSLLDPSNGPTDPGHSTTRRRLLGGIGTISAVALAGCAGGGNGSPTPTEGETAIPTTADPMTPETETETEKPMSMNPDIPLLNYALTLEHLENAFYRDGLERFADDELSGADVLSAFEEAVKADVPQYLTMIGQHEAAHVGALAATIEDLGNVVDRTSTMFCKPSWLVEWSKTIKETNPWTDSLSSSFEPSALNGMNGWQVAV